MPEKRIAAGAEPVEIAHGSQDGIEFVITHLEGGEVYLDHNYRDVQANPAHALTRGDSHRLTNIRSGVFAYAPGEEGAVVRVSRNDGFTLVSFPTTTAERPADRAARQGRKESRSLVVNLATDGSDTANVITQAETADGPVEVERITTASWDGFTRDARIRYAEYDENDIRTTEWYVQPGESLNFEGYRLAQGHYLEVFTTNFGPATNIATSAIWRAV